jgi:hypothetical protein
MAKAMTFGGAGEGKELQENQFRGRHGLFQCKINCFLFIFTSSFLAYVFCTYSMESYFNIVVKCFLSPTQNCSLPVPGLLPRVT